MRALADFFSILLERLLHAVQGAGVVCDVSIMDACVSSEALMALGYQRTVLQRLPEYAVPSHEAYDPI